MKFVFRIILVLVSGSLLFLCFPPFGWWPLVIVSLTALFAAVTNTTSSRAFYLGMLQGIVGYGIALHWFFHVVGIAAIPLFFILAFFTAVFCMLYNCIARWSHSPYFVALVAGTLWTAIEFYRSELFFLRFPWITPGTALGPTLLSPVFGVYAVSFIVAAASAALIRRRTLPLAAALCVLFLLLGIFKPGEVNPAGENAINVTLIQREASRLQDYLELTRDAQDPEPDLIVWPEYAIPYDVRKREEKFNQLTELCAETGAVLVTGTKTESGDSNDSGWRNTALVVDENGVIGEYYKARPVHFMNDGIPGRSFEPIDSDIGALATPICFDCDYTTVTRRMADLGAEYFAVPSFDAVSWGRTQHLQHAVLFRLRAAENGRWLACAASSGVSQIIDPHGNVHKRLPPLKTGTLTYTIFPEEDKTIFTKGGWLFPWAAMAGAVVILAYAGLSRVLESRKGVSHQSPSFSEASQRERVE